MESCWRWHKANITTKFQISHNVCPLFLMKSYNTLNSSFMFEHCNYSRNKNSIQMTCERFLLVNFFFLPLSILLSHSFYNVLPEKGHPIAKYTYLTTSRLCFIQFHSWSQVWFKSQQASKITFKIESTLCDTKQRIWLFCVSFTSHFSVLILELYLQVVLICATLKLIENIWFV